MYHFQNPAIQKVGFCNPEIHARISGVSEGPAMPSHQAPDYGHAADSIKDRVGGDVCKAGRRTGSPVLMHLSCLKTETLVYKPGSQA